MSLNNIMAAFISKIYALVPIVSISEWLIQHNVSWIKYYHVENTTIT